MKFIIAEKLTSRVSSSLLLHALDKELKEISSGINISYRIIGFNERNWIKVEAIGEDVEVFQELIKIKFGLAKTNLNELKIGDICKGFIMDDKSIENGINVDIGLINPISKNAFYPLHTIRAQLANGKSLNIKEIINKYCLYDGFPIKVRITSIDYENGNVEVELLNDQAEYLKSIISFPFEKVLIFDVFKDQLLKVLKSTYVEKDIASIKQISLSTFILVFKLEVNSLRIVSKISQLLKGSRIYVLRPLQIEY